MEIKSTVYDLGKGDAAEFITFFAPGGLVGTGFANLLIARDLPGNAKEILEIRFKTDFLPHVKRLVDELERLCEYEEARTQEMLETAQSFADGELNDVKPFEKEIGSAAAPSRQEEGQPCADPDLMREIGDALEELQSSGEEEDHPGEEEQQEEGEDLEF